MTNLTHEQPAQNATSRPCVTCNTIRYLFGKLFARYGSKWTAQYPDAMLPVVQQEWLEVLGHLTPEQFRHGLETWRGDWPPNAMEFLNACSSNQGEARPYHKALEPPKIERGSTDVARNAIEQCRAYLSGGGNNVAT